MLLKNVQESQEENNAILFKALMKCSSVWEPNQMLEKF